MVSFERIKALAILPENPFSIVCLCLSVVCCLYPGRESWFRKMLRFFSLNGYLRPHHFVYHIRVVSELYFSPVPKAAAGFADVFFSCGKPGQYFHLRAGQPSRAEPAKRCRIIDANGIDAHKVALLHKALLRYPNTSCYAVFSLSANGNKNVHIHARKKFLTVLKVYFDEVLPPRCNR